MNQELAKTLRRIRRERKTSRLKQLIKYILSKGKEPHPDELDLKLFAELFPLNWNVDIDAE